MEKSQSTFTEYVLAQLEELEEKHSTGQCSDGEYALVKEHLASIISD